MFLLNLDISKMTRKSERWKRNEEHRLKRLLLIRFGILSLVGAISFGGLYLFNRYNPKDFEKFMTLKMKSSLRN